MPFPYCPSDHGRWLAESDSEKSQTQQVPAFDKFGKIGMHESKANFNIRCKIYHQFLKCN